MLGALAGVALQLMQARLWPAWVDGGLGLGALLLGWASARAWGVHRRWALGALMLAAACAGGGWAGARAGLRLADTLDPAWAGRDVQLTGVVAEMPQWRADGVGLLLDVVQAEVDGRPVRGVPARVALSWRAGLQEGELRAGPQREVKAGQRWQFTVRLYPPLGAMNPHGFDSELWWFERGVRATGVVRSRQQTPARWLADTWVHPVEQARGAVRAALYAQVADTRAAGVLAGLALGDQGAIEAQDWALFRRTGIAHLLAVSGLHITMFAWAAQALVAWAWRRSAWAVRRCDAGAAGRWGGLALATAYALFAGWGVPAQRTVWMLAVVTVLRSPRAGLALDPAVADVRGRGGGHGSVGAVAGGVLAVLRGSGLADAGSPGGRRAGRGGAEAACGKRPVAPCMGLAQSSRGVGHAHAAARQPGSGAAVVAVLPSGVGGRWGGEPAGHSLGELCGHAAGLARGAGARLVDGRRLDGGPHEPGAEPDGGPGQAPCGAQPLRRAGPRPADCWRPCWPWHR